MQKLTNQDRVEAIVLVAENAFNTLNHEQGSKNLFCASRRIFRAEPGRHFSGRDFFQRGRNRSPRLTSLGAK